MFGIITGIVYQITNLLAFMLFQPCMTLFLQKDKKHKMNI